MKYGKTKSSSRGFNLPELLVVTATLSLLVVLVLPALARTDASGQSFRCLNNHKQLVTAWMLYAQDYRGNLVPNPGSPALSTPAWAPGNMQHPVDRTNTALIQSGLLFPYAKSLEIYTCPGNKTTQIRGISINTYMNSNEGGSTSQYQLFRKSAQISQPSKLFVTMDEDETTINDGLLLLRGQSIAGSIWLYDWPGSSHNGAGVISFADGHAELHQWKTLGRPTAFHNPATGTSLPGPRRADGIYLITISTLPTSGSW